MYRTRHVAGRSYRARPKTAIAAARNTASRIARSARIAAYREAPMLANLAVRGLNLAEGEFKAVDVVGSGTISQTPTVVLLNGIARGDDIGERTGREVDLRSIQASITLNTGNVAQQHRVVIVYDRQTNASAATMAQVLNAVNIRAARNLENRKRFSILFDKTYILTAAAIGTSNTKHINWYRHLRHPETFNSGDAGTVADITTGSIYLMVYGTVAPGGGADNGSMDSFTRIRYLDK